MAPLEPDERRGQVKLPKGVSVLTLRILTEGNMNLGYLEFRRK